MDYVGIMSTGSTQERCRHGVLLWGDWLEDESEPQRVHIFSNGSGSAIPRRSWLLTAALSKSTRAESSSVLFRFPNNDAATTNFASGSPDNQLIYLEGAKSRPVWTRSPIVGLPIGSTRAVIAGSPASRGATVWHC